MVMNKRLLCLELTLKVENFLGVDNKFNFANK